MELSGKLVRAERLAKIAWRRRRDTVRCTFDPTETREFRFHQFKRGTARFFYERLGKTDIRVRDTPHYAFASALVANHNAEIIAGEAYYDDYLRASWPVSRHVHIPERIAAFRAHFEAARQRKRQPSPILSYLEATESAFVIDGNHRFAFAAALEMPIEAEIWPYDLAFLAFANIPAFYGTGRKNRPYQSILYRGNKVVPGRRDDAATRMKLIPAHVIQGKRVLDVASNFGMSSMLARQFGATSCFGIELSEPMVNLASRFAMFEEAFPHVQFQTFDLDQSPLPRAEFDTAFIFSVYAHLKQPDNLNKLIADCVKKYVIFEAHPGHSRTDYRNVFEAGLFSSITQLGALATSVYTEGKSRTLWLCERQ